MTISGSYDSSAAIGLANKNWEAQYTYDTLVAPDSSGFYYSAFSAASFSVDGNIYRGISGPLSGVFGSPMAQAGSYAWVTDSSMWDRLEFRGNLFLDGNPSSQSLEIYEIVLADTTPSLWASTSLPEGFDFNQINYISMSTRSSPSSALDNGTIQSVSFQTIPEPSSVFFIIGPIALLFRRLC